METKHLSYFKVENFKRFDSLEVKDIGQFNLIVGDNNVGKTSLLEALLFDDEDYDSWLINFDYSLENRDIYINDYNLNFLDFYFKNKKLPIKYSYRKGTSSKNNIIDLIKKTKNQLTESDISILGANIKLYDSPYFAQFIQNSSNAIKIVRVANDRKDVDSYFSFLGSKIFYDEETIDFAFTISKSNKKLEKFKEELKFFIPGITSVEVSNAILPEDVIIIRESGSDTPRAISEYGDGFIKLFRCLLKMELSINKRLMIDEIDTGIHYSRMKDFLKKVIQSAKNKNVQIFATTHSKECIEYYTQALKELGFENEGRIIRIADTKNGIKAYTMNYAQLENSLEAESEIR